MFPSESLIYVLSCIFLVLMLISIFSWCILLEANVFFFVHFQVASSPKTIRGVATAVSCGWVIGCDVGCGRQSRSIRWSSRRPNKWRKWPAKRLAWTRGPTSTYRSSTCIRRILAVKPVLSVETVRRPTCWETTC